MTQYIVTCADRPPRLIEAPGRYDACNRAHLDDVGGSENLFRYMAAEIDIGDWGCEVIYPETGRRYRAEYAKTE